MSLVTAGQSRHLHYFALYRLVQGFVVQTQKPLVKKEKSKQKTGKEIKKMNLLKDIKKALLQNKQEQSKHDETTYSRHLYISPDIKP